MSLFVRRLRVIDLPALERIEMEAVARYPARVGWLSTFRRHIERALSEEPEGILVAELNEKVVGGAIARQRGPHPLTGQKHGALLSLSCAEAYAKHQVLNRLLLEAFAYLKSRGCQSVLMQVPVGSDAEAELLKSSGFTVAAYDFERAL